MNPEKSPLYIVCGCKPWCARVREVLEEKGVEGRWRYIADETELLSVLLCAMQTEEFCAEQGGVVIPTPTPTYIFFTHWNWIVPPEVTSAFPCVNFHMTALPFGRGGSPLQNLVERGFVETVVTAHYMTDAVDAGAIITTSPSVSLCGTAEAIYDRVQRVIATMIQRIVEGTYTPHSCERGVLDRMVFKRRTPAQSELPKSAGDLEAVHNHIRMLDATTYPRAFLRWGNLELEFTGSNQYMGEVRASVMIRMVAEGDSGSATGKEGVHGG